MYECLERMPGSLDSVLRSLRINDLSPREARDVLRVASEIERRAYALKLLVTSRATADESWAATGARSAEGWIADQLGIGYGEAAATLNASSKVSELPSLEAAVRGAALNGAQAREVASAADASNVDALVGAAQRSSVDQLRRQARQENARKRSDADERARAAKAHRERYFKSWVDGEGAFRFEGSCTAMDGSRLLGAIDNEADRVFKQAWKEGRREPIAAYRFDALLRLISGGATAPRSKPEVIIRVDASRLAGGDGMCETTVGGAVPVDDAVGAILAGAFAKVVLFDGVDVLKVVHPGRRWPAVIDTAVLERDGHRCVHCGSRTALELHHFKLDVAKGGLTAVWTLATLCSPCHDLVTYKGYVLAGKPGAWEWIPPSRPPP